MKLALALLGTLFVCQSATAAPRHLRVLFVGNSLTAANDLPTVVAKIGASRHVTIDTRTFAAGGYALEDHWAEGSALAALREGGWDTVVLQQGPSSLPESGVNLTEWARRWADEARRHGARPALLTVWPERERRYAFPDVIRHYAAAARSAHAALFPAGTAWRYALARGARLYGPDGFHPSPTGSYLAAIVVYAGLTGELPRNLPPLLRKAASVAFASA